MRHRRGFSGLYLVTSMVALAGITSFAVDYGRVNVARTELLSTAHAAARAAANQLDVSFSAVRSAAVALGAANHCDGQPVAIDPANDVEIGYWNLVTRTFTATNTNPNAVRVHARRTEARGNGIPLLFAKILGRSYCDAEESAIAMLTPALSQTVIVPGTSDPYLAGMPAGSRASTTDTAPSQSPVQVNAIPLVPGQALNFSFTGNVRNNPTYNDYQPDGNLSWILQHDNRAENGVANVTMPINAQLGVFLDDNAPNTTAAPAALDFSSAASREFKTLSPGLKQPFLIGDGKDSQGNVQQFIVPKGATRLYLGTMDGFEWSNNVGFFQTTISHPRAISLVK